MKKNSTNDELLLEVQLFIKRWIKENSEQIHREMLKNIRTK